MLRTIVLSLSALMIALPSQAGIVDMFNGVTVGAPLPKNNIVFLSAPPPTTNNVQLIDFWATTCAPCRTSIPELNALHHKYSPKGLVVIGVSEEPRETVVPFLEKVPMHYSSAVEGTASLHKALRIRALPYAIFVNRSGTVVWRGQPSEITGELIESLLAP